MTPDELKREINFTRDGFLNECEARGLDREECHKVLDVAADVGMCLMPVRATKRIQKAMAKSMEKLRPEGVEWVGCHEKHRLRYENAVRKFQAQLNTEER